MKPMPAPPWGLASLGWVQAEEHPTLLDFVLFI